jgi:hypothetical protein
LTVAGELPSDPEVELAYSLEDVFEWYQDCPFQIERAAIVGGRSVSVVQQMGTRALSGAPTLRLLTSANGR